MSIGSLFDRVYGRVASILEGIIDFGNQVVQDFWDTSGSIGAESFTFENRQVKVDVVAQEGQGDQGLKSSC